MAHRRRPLTSLDSIPHAWALDSADDVGDVHNGGLCRRPSKTRGQQVRLAWGLGDDVMPGALGFSGLGRTCDNVSKARGPGIGGISLRMSASLPVLRPLRHHLSKKTAPESQQFFELTGGLDVHLRKRTIPLVEHRGIMVKQMEHLVDYIKARSKPKSGQIPSWSDPVSGEPLSLWAMNLYQISYWIIKPMTLQANCSYVEAVAFSEKAQIPQWFVSHWWGEPFVDFVAGVKKHSNVRHPPLDGVCTPYWISAFAINQHDSTDDTHHIFLEEEPQEAFNRAFNKALWSCEGVLLVLDALGPSVPFQRLWCDYEISVATDASTGLRLDIVAADDQGELHLLTDGLTEHEAALEAVSRRAPWKESGWAVKTRREDQFPVQMMREGVLLTLVEAQTSLEKDRKTILNTIAGKSVTAFVDTENPIYAELDRRVRSRLAILALRSALQQEVDIADDSYLPIPKAIREDVNRDVLDLNLSNCWKLKDEHYEVIRSCLSRSRVRRLSLNFSSCHQLTTLPDFTPQMAEMPFLREFCLVMQNCISLTNHGEFADLGRRISMLKTLQAISLNFKGCVNIGPLNELVTNILKNHHAEVAVVSPEGESMAKRAAIPQVEAKRQAPVKKKEWMSVTAQAWARK